MDISGLRESSNVVDHTSLFNALRGRLEKETGLWPGSLFPEMGDNTYTARRLHNITHPKPLDTTTVGYKDGIPVQVTKVSPFDYTDPFSGQTTRVNDKQYNDYLSAVANAKAALDAGNTN